MSKRQYVLRLTAEELRLLIDVMDVGLEQTRHWADVEALEAKLQEFLDEVERLEPC